MKKYTALLILTSLLCSLAACGGTAPETDTPGGDTTAADTAPAETTAPAAPEKKLSLLNAALEVLKSGDESLTTRQMVAAAKDRGLWTPGSGKTPEQTLYSAIMREIRDKGDASRFVKDARGHFKARA